MSILRTSGDRDPDNGARVRWNEENLLFNDENRGHYDKIEEAPTPYLPPLDMKVRQDTSRLSLPISDD